MQSEKERVKASSTNLASFSLKPSLPNNFFRVAFGKPYQGDDHPSSPQTSPAVAESRTFWGTPQSEGRQHDGHPLWPRISRFCKCKPYFKPQENACFFQLASTNSNTKKLIIKRRKYRHKGIILALILQTPHPSCFPSTKCELIFKKTQWQKK